MKLTAVVRLVSMVLIAAFTLLAERVVGASSFGEFATLFAVAQLLAVPLSSLDRPLIREVASREGASPRDALGPVVRVGGALSIGGLSAVIALYAMRSPWVLPALLVILTSLFAGTTLAVQAAHRGAGSFIAGQFPYELVRPLSMLAVVGLLAIVAAERRTPLLLLVGVAIAHAIALALLAGSTMRGPRKEPIRWRSDNWSAYWAFLTLTFAGTVLDRAPLIAVGLISEDKTQAASVALGLRVAQLLATGLAIANFRYMPDVVTALSRGHKSASRIVQRIAWSGMALGAVPAAMLAIWPWLVTLLFGIEYTPYEVVFRLIAIAAIVNLLGGPAQVVLSMAGHERRVTSVMSFVAVLVSLGSTIGAWLGGATGAIAVYLLGVLVWNVTLAIDCRRILGVHSLPSPSWLAREISNFRASR